MACPKIPLGSWKPAVGSLIGSRTTGAVKWPKKAMPNQNSALSSVWQQKHSTRVFSYKPRRLYHTSKSTQSTVEFELPEINEAKAFLGQNKYVKAEALVIRAQEIAKFAVGEKSLPYAELVELQGRCKFGKAQYYESAVFFQDALQTFLSNAQHRASMRILPDYVASILRTNSSSDINRFLVYARGLGRTGDSELDVMISLAKMQLRALEYHRERINGANSSMQTIEEDILSLIQATDINGLNTTSYIVCRWYLSVGRWHQTLFELRKEETNRKNAEESYNLALKVKGQGSRESDLVMADALLGLGDLARLTQQWEEADEYYKRAVDITDRYFDRDSQRVRRVVEREAIVQFHLRRWLHTEGLLRRLIDHYSEHNPLDAANPAVTCPQAQFDCLDCYVKMMETRGRGSEVATLKAQLQAVASVTPSPTFDPYAF